MGLHKGQTNNPNGRKSGVSNKLTGDLRAKVNQIIENNIGTIQKDIESLEPKDRLLIFEKLLKYSIPTLSSVSVEAQIQAEYNELKKLLETAPEDAIEAITQKILTLKNQTNETETEN